MAGPQAWPALAAAADRVRLVEHDLRAAGHGRELTHEIDDTAAEVSTHVTL